MGTTSKPLGFFTKLSYGLGSSAFGVKNNGFDYFLLFFYTSVLGFDARIIGFSLLVALVFDALSDPIVGYLSDNTVTKWGRRHPYMYGSAIPVAVTYYFLWVPPSEMTNVQAFFYVTVLSILIRTLITLYETPSSALAPELTQEYNQRTNLLSYRYFFGWTGGNMMSVIMFAFLINLSTTHEDGRFDPATYEIYGLIAAILIFVSILASAIGTHHYIPHLKRNKAESKSLKTIFSELRDTLMEKSFFALFLASIFSAIASGVAAALTFRLLTYFWGFSSEQIFIWTSFVFISAILGAMIAPIVSRKLGKRKGTLVLGVIAFGLAPLPVILRIFGLLPLNEEPILFWLIVVFNTLDLSLIIAMSVLFASMIADLVEQSELKTKRRSEGVFFSAITFSRKSVQGFGVLIAGFIIEAAAFPENAKPGEVPEETLRLLGLLYAPALWILWGLMLVSISYYTIDKAKHEQNLSTLANSQANS